jgi:hypothetical protein
MPDETTVEMTSMDGPEMMPLEQPGDQQPDEEKQPEKKSRHRWQKDPEDPAKVACTRCWQDVRIDEKNRPSYLVNGEWVSAMPACPGTPVPLLLQMFNHERQHKEQYAEQLKTTANDLAVARTQIEVCGPSAVSTLKQNLSDAESRVQLVLAERDSLREHLDRRVKELEAKISSAEARMLQGLRRRMSKQRSGITHDFDLAGHHGYVTVNCYEDGSPGEIFINVSKQGSTINGLLNCWARACSLALQCGLPAQELAHKFVGFAFEPLGNTDNPDIPQAKSIVDYIARWVDRRFCSDAHGVAISWPWPPMEKPHHRCESCNIECPVIKGGHCPLSQPDLPTRDGSPEGVPAPVVGD